ncbi:hypothetical protein [Gottfriedia acidiceleris]|uniref:hypothetical protein n=1 Tax=Gottfriedia acidiceleris TaxID=371036 RepID=UPI002FFD6353
MQKIFKTVLTSFIALIMCLGVFTPKSHAEEVTPNVIAEEVTQDVIASPPDGGCEVSPDVIASLPDGGCVTQDVIASPPEGGSMHGEIASYQVTATGETIVDMYMDVKTAQQYSEKVTQSNTEQVAWWGTTLLLGPKAPQTSLYVGFLGLCSSIQRGNIATKVRSYTNKNQKVHVGAYVSYYQSQGVVNYVVQSWDGKSVDFRKVSGIRNINVSYY